MPITEPTKPVHCPRCDKPFPTMREMYSHVRKAHPGYIEDMLED